MSTASDSKPDWDKFGLQTEQLKLPPISDDDKYEEEDMEENELFNSDPEQKKKPWWKTNFLVTGTVKFGTWDGVFTSCMLNIFGIVIFLRTGWMVGIAGLGLSFLIVSLTMLVALVTVTSAVGVCERCQVESGGVYFLLTHVLGARISTSIGMLYCFGQAVASALYLTGLGESICNLAGWTNPWIAKAIGSGVLVLLLIINLAGVKWVVRIQLILLMILFISVLDFLVGSCIKQSPEFGVLGYSIEIFKNNTAPQFTKEYGFFTVFGVFFPTATGVCAGINMSGNLYNPRKSIPQGTLAAVGVSCFLYLCFIVALGGTCTRDTLQTDNMITAKVALLGPLLLFGLYVSSLSAALGGVTTAPRLLVVMSETSKLPATAILNRTWGRNKVPVVSILSVITVTLACVLLGDINVLGPIVTLPFLLTYGSLTYSYFILANTFDIRQRRERLYAAISRSSQPGSQSSERSVTTNGGNAPETAPHQQGDNASDDLNNLFPERKYYGSMKEEPPTVEKSNGKLSKIIQQPRSYYSVLINRWISLCGTILFLALMVAVNWLYTIIILIIWVLLYMYVGWLCPGLTPGVAEFSVATCIRQKFIARCGSSSSPISGSHRSGPSAREHERLIMPPQTPSIDTTESSVTEKSEDFLDRSRFHQTQHIQDDKVTRAFTGQEEARH